MSFTHLQVKSGYSLMNSTITIEKLVERAVELNFSALALTDEHVLYGAVPFYKACQKHGIKPIIGMIVNILHDDEANEQCILLAKNNDGYKQLIKLSTHIQVGKKEGIEKKELGSFTENTVCIFPIQKSSLRQSIKTDSHQKVEAYVDKWKGMFEEGDFYLGIQDHGLEDERRLHKVIKAFHEYNRTPVVAINDICYLNEKDDMAYECLQSMKHDQRWSMKKADPSNRYRHLRSALEMEQIYGSYWPEVLQETERIQEKCHVAFDFNQRMLPSFPVPEDIMAHAYLEKLCWEYVELKYNTVTKEISSRLTYELDIIKSMDYSDYFLIVWDFIKYAKEKDILVGPGRGSSAGSLVAFVLGITEVDPIKYNLLFERFLNPERITMPDIDIDFSDYRRDEVIEYVKNKYGEERVAQIITFGTFAARSVIRELIKTIGIDQQDAHFILKEIPVQSGKPLVDLIKASEELRQYIKQSEKLTLLFSIAVKLEGLPRHISTHAAGVVISEKPLIEQVPLTRGTHELNLTQFSMNDLEALGLLKIDFLGLRNLTLLERILQSIRYSFNKELTLVNIPERDSKTFDLLQAGKTNGIFQLESEGMKHVLTRLKPTLFDDIVAVNALYRPGPMAFIQTYINRKHQKEKVVYPHPDLKPILEKTYGVLIYQEQIMQIAHQIAGYSLGQADILRRAVSKKQSLIMSEQKENFIQGCKQNGYDDSVSEELFAWIVKFSNYGFPKSHAVAYSKISYQLAYLKAHYPTHFYAELLSSVVNQQEKVHAYIQEIKSFGIPIKPPSINKSYGKYTVDNECIRMGLLSIKGIGSQVVKEVVRVRKDGPFKSLFDFCLRVSFKAINRATLEQLIMAGVFDETYKNRASLLASIDQAIEQGELFREFNDQTNLFHDQLELEANYVDIDDFSEVKKLADEKELLGIYVSSHPLKQHRKKLRENGYITMENAQHLIGKKNVKSAAIIQSIKTIRTKRGDPMAFITLGDETNELDGVVFPELYRQSKMLLKEEMIIYLSGSIEQRNNRVQWLLNEIQPFDETLLNNRTKQRLFIKLTEKTSGTALEVIRHKAQRYPGDTPIIIYDKESKKSYQLSEDYFINPSHECLTELNNYFGLQRVVLEK